MSRLSIASYMLAVISVFMGFYKMFIYESDYPSKNAYVGGDAYNYIINAGYTTAWFVLAIFFLLAGFIIYYTGLKHSKEIKTEIHLENQEVDSETTSNI